MKCCFGFTELSLLESGDEVFIEMLQRGVAPEQCPERLKGLYWMQDNLANEVLVTWQDAYWRLRTGYMSCPIRRELCGPWPVPAPQTPATTVRGTYRV